MKGKKLMLVGLVFVLALGIMISGCSQQKTQYLSIGTGGVSGVYYPMGGGISKIINNHVDGVETTVESTGGSVANLNLLKKGEAKLGIVASNIAYNAHNGIGDYEGEPIEKANGVAALYPEAVQIVTLKSSDIKTFEDLKGKKVAVGKPGSGVEVMAQELLELHGMSYDDIDEDFVGFSEAATGLSDRNMDAAIVWAGVPTSGVVDVATKNPIRLIEIEEKKLEELENKLAYCSHQVIEPETYNGIEEPTTTLAIPAMLIASSELDEELVYDITKSIFDNLDTLSEVHERGKDVSLDTALDGMSISLHPGAEKYYKEAGILE